MRSKISPRIRFTVEDVIDVVFSKNIFNRADSNKIIEYPQCSTK